jgi:DNA-binding NarL/FixJ family response regulator
MVYMGKEYDTMTQAKPKTITLLLADDHPVARRGVRGILSSAPDIQIVGEAENGDGIKELIPKFCPDILLLDLKMPGTDLTEVEKWVRENYPETVTLVLSAHDRDHYLAGMIEAGVAGYLHKSERSENLISAIRRVAHGEYLITNLTYNSRRILYDYLLVHKQKRNHPDAVSFCQAISGLDYFLNSLYHQH